MPIIKRVAILGTRGVPAKYGGFETFAEKLSLYLTSRGWQVTVYCQGERGSGCFERRWRDVELVTIPAPWESALGTVVFDLKSVLHSLGREGAALTLGYNTAVFSALYRLKGKANVMNMDGIEWRRGKWRWYQKAWLYGNEKLGCLLAERLIADHPEIREHLRGNAGSGEIACIPYGADQVQNADPSLLERYGVKENAYCLVVARVEPENSVAEIVGAFSEKRRDFKLAVVGAVDPGRNSYHRKVQRSAGDEVLFLGAVYDKPALEALRYFCRLHIHGHTVGGTNPSLVEAMGAGSAIAAHDNRFNRWVLGPEGFYFSDREECGRLFDRLLADEAARSAAKAGSVRRHAAVFSWDKVLRQYETLLEEVLHRRGDSG